MFIIYLRETYDLNRRLQNLKNGLITIVSILKKLLGKRNIIKC